MEENFKDLLEQYWDEDEVNQKLSDDEEELEDSVVVYNNSRIDSPFNVNDEISIGEYVNKFLGMMGDYSNLRHFELKKLNCPYVIGVANEYANNNPTFVKDKKLLLIVIDRNGNRGTYINPIIAHEYFDYDYEEAKKRLNQRTFNHFDKFFEEYKFFKAEYEAYQEFFNILKETKKIHKIKKIEDYENQLGDEDNDKHKR